MLVKIKAIAATIALILVSVLLGEAIYWVWVTSPKIYETVSNVNDTSGKIRDYIDYQIDVVKSPAYQKNFEHASELGDIAAKTVAQVARQTIPRLNKNLDMLMDTQLELKRGSGNLADFIKDTNFSVNQKLLPEVAEVSKKLGVSVNDVDEVVKEGLVSVQTLNKILADPNIQETMTHLNSAASGLDETSWNISEATGKFPELFDLINSYIKTSNKWHKWILLAQILNILGGIPRP